MISAISFGKRSDYTIQRRKETKTGLETAQNVLRRAQNKFGRPHSDTYLTMKRRHHQNDPKYADINKRLQEKASVYQADLFLQPYLTIDRKPSGRVSGGILGNCGECARAIQKEFLEEGALSVNVEMRAEGKDLSCNHFFTLSNIREGTDLKNPKTWGEQAIVTDLWSGISMKANDAILYYQRLFLIDPDRTQIEFGAMPDRDDSFQEQIIEYLKLKR